MKRQISSLALLCFVLTLSLSACGVLRDAAPTPQPTQVLQISADQAAQAMEDDHFYSSYGQTTLLIQGTVAAVDAQPEHTLLTLATQRATVVLCDLGAAASAVKIGDSVTVRVADPEQDVARQDQAVFIKNCTIP